MRGWDVPVSVNELMSSRSSQHAMNFWPRPMVYLPLGTLSKISSSSSEMHYWSVRAVIRLTFRRETYALGEVHLHREDTDILGAGSGRDVLAGGSVEGDGHVCFGEGRARRSVFCAGMEKEARSGMSRRGGGLGVI